MSDYQKTGEAGSELKQWETLSLFLLRSRSAADNRSHRRLFCFSFISIAVLTIIFGYDKFQALYHLIIPLFTFIYLIVFPGLENKRHLKRRHNSKYFMYLDATKKWLFLEVWKAFQLNSIMSRSHFWFQLMKRGNISVPVSLVWNDSLICYWKHKCKRKTEMSNKLFSFITIWSKIFEFVWVIIDLWTVFPSFNNIGKFT